MTGFMNYLTVKETSTDLKIEYTDKNRPHIRYLAFCNDREVKWFRYIINIGYNLSDINTVHEPVKILEVDKAGWIYELLKN